MDRRDFVALLGSIPFLNKLAIETMPESDISKIEPIDETTLLVIRKAQAITEGFLTGFKNCQFEVLSVDQNEPSIPLVVNNYTIKNGVAKIEFKGVKLSKKMELGVVVAKYKNQLFSTFVINSLNLNNEDTLMINVALSIAC